MSKGECEKALRESGYKNVSLIYTGKKDIKQKRNRFRNIIWFNPPFNKNFSTNTVKVSYSCTQNISSMIKPHNKKVINKDVKELKSCSCRVKSECPLNGQCQVTDILVLVYFFIFPFVIKIQFNFTKCE